MVASERATILAELSPSYMLRPASGASTPLPTPTPLVLSLPHSGRVYPRAFLEASKLELAALRRSEDAFVDELFGEGPALGAPLLAARFPRAYLDVNRERYELDPVLFREPLPDYANTRSPRVLGGLGTIARVVAEAEEIYREPLSLSAGLERIARLYVPYHAALAALIARARRRCGVAILLDCHSMPGGVNTAATGGSSATDFVLGDRFGSSCDPALTQLVGGILSRMGYRVAFNRPYAGGHITEHYGRPRDGMHALQIEIAKPLYMNEETITRHDGFEKLRQALSRLLAEVIERAPALLRARGASAAATAAE